MEHRKSRAKMQTMSNDIKRDGVATLPWQRRDHRAGRTVAGRAHRHSGAVLPGCRDEVHQGRKVGAGSGADASKGGLF